VRYGIFGGAFDPPHAGHLAVAQVAHDSLNLDRVIYVPSFAPPHRSRPLASFHHRLGMLKSLLAGCPWAGVSGVEIDLNAPTFTYDMVKAIKTHQGFQDTPFLLVGADNYQSFTSWHRWQELLNEVEIVVYPRGNALPNALSEVPARFLNAPLRSEQSTDLRQAFLHSEHPESIPCLPQVSEYILQHHLYQPSSPDA
jgi:nicotinate-nucleotide adenylyltransferase